MPILINYHETYIKKHGIPLADITPDDIRIKCRCGRSTCKKKARFYCPRCSRINGEIAAYWTNFIPNDDNNCFLQHMLKKLPD